MNTNCSILKNTVSKMKTNNTIFIDTTNMDENCIDTLKMLINSNTIKPLSNMVKKYYSNIDNYLMQSVLNGDLILSKMDYIKL